MIFSFFKISMQRKVRLSQAQIKQNFPDQKAVTNKILFYENIPVVGELYLCKKIQIKPASSTSELDALRIGPTPWQVGRFAGQAHFIESGEPPSRRMRFPH
jgi:hypothetical protein